MSFNTRVLPPTWKKTTFTQHEMIEKHSVSSARLEPCKGEFVSSLTTTIFSELSFYLVSG